jgi:hypothetical protein
MRTIPRNVTHRHRFQAIGAHTLHAGTKPKKAFPYPDVKIPIREVRLVKKCSCGELRVHISQHLAAGLPIPISRYKRGK